MEKMECSFDKTKRIWSGPKRQPLYDYNCSVGKILFNSLRNHSENVLQICDTDGRSVTNAEMLLWATRAAQRLKKMSLRQNDVVGIVAKNSTYLMPIVVGCLMNCTPFHAVPPVFDEDNVQYLFGLTEPKVIFCDGDSYDMVLKTTKSLRPLIYTLTDHIAGVPQVEDLLLQPTQMERFYRPENLTKGGAQTMAILCSSGTTGTPKCVCISNYCLVSENLLSSADVGYTSCDPGWITGLNLGVLATITGCTRIITNRPYTPEYFVKLVQKYKINFVAIASTHAVQLLNCPTATTENLSSLQSLRWGGAGLTEASIQRLSKLLPRTILSYGYGLTEVNGVAANLGIQFATSAGKLSPGIRVRIVDDNGKNLAHNEIGEILVHNGYEWNGYYNNPLDTRTVQDSLGWFHTGDLGYFDDKNFLFIVDRMKDVMRYDSMDFYPSELERVICELPEVQDVCVVGVYDERIGHKAGALVVRKSGCALSEQKVVEHVRQRMVAHYKQLHAGVRFTDILPQNNNGKILRKEAVAFFETKKE